MESVSRFEPAYLALGPEGLRRRAERAVEMLANCRACPRDCGVNRLEDKWAACKTGRHAVVGSHFPHFGRLGKAGSSPTVELVLRVCQGHPQAEYAHTCWSHVVFAGSLQPVASKGQSAREAGLLR